MTHHKNDWKDLAIIVAGMGYQELMEENEELRKKIAAMEGGNDYVPPRRMPSSQEKTNWNVVLLVTVILVILMVGLCMLPNLNSP
jgi:hypothetical protein